MADDELILAFHSGRVFSFVRATEYSPSSFGGPLEIELLGVRHGPRSLHMLARLSSSELPVLGAPACVFELPLIYGFCYSGCQIKYKLESSTKVEILDLDPTASSDDFPYRDYPVLLPYAPLKVSQVRECTYSEFVAAFPNMPDEQPADVVVAIPPPATLGVSLWGRWGDPEEVTVIFECDLGAKIVSAYNICT
jgi:hypothetical protein